jgi:hypothetical protein
LSAELINKTSRNTKKDIIKDLLRTNKLISTLNNINDIRIINDRADASIF